MEAIRVLTLFANQRVISVVGIVRISNGGTATITEGAEVKFYSVSSRRKTNGIVTNLRIHVRTAQSDLSCGAVSS